VMGMARSGTSLTTSIIADMLLRNGSSDVVWRGGAPAYPVDKRNPHGYFERADVVALNYKYVRELTGASWATFPHGYAAGPALLNFSSAAASQTRRGFEKSAFAILQDMELHAPWVLKDVRFARTLPLWWPLLSAPVCVIPYRHPLEVAASSRLHSVSLWENYVVSALASARATNCPTLLVSYAKWLEPVAAQLVENGAKPLRGHRPVVPPELS
jgi:hypothetical protein